MNSGTSQSVGSAPKTLLIRTDASVKIGTGHAMRCIALAQAWQSSGGKAVFAMAEPAEWIRQRLLVEEMELVAVQVQPGSNEDAREVANLAHEFMAQWVVVDGYHFDSNYQRQIKDADCRLLLVDDAGKASPYCADIVLNQNLHAMDEMYSERASYTQLLLGTRYLLLRRDFLASREVERPISRVARRFLVTMGGSDPDNTTAMVIETLEELQVPGWEAIAVLGQNSAYFTALSDAIRKKALPIKLIENVANMADLMHWADLTITAGGTTIWELAFMGAPAVAVSRAEHERMLLWAAAGEGIAINLGNFQSLTSHELGKEVASLAFDEAARLKMSKAGRAFIDGKGATRVVETLEKVDATQK